MDSTHCFTNCYVSGHGQDMEGRNLFSLVSLSSLVSLWCEHLTRLSVITVLKICNFYLPHAP